MVVVSRNSQNNSSPTFETFFHGWLIRQENYLHQLLYSLEPVEFENEPRLSDLINRVMAHYNEYHEAKSRIAHAYVFLLFAPPWLTSFERTFLWLAGFKPGLLFRLVANSVQDLTEDQAQTMGILAEETREEERELAEEMARIQEDVVAAAVERMRSEMESLVGSADLLRSKTVVKVIEVLSMGQKVRFLAAAAQFQLRIRSWGILRDAQRPYAVAG